MPQQYSIKLVDDAVPRAVCTPRRVPLPLMTKVKEELDRLVKLKVIRQTTEPTDWCAPIVVVPKRESHAIRMCVDFTELNKFVKRERHILPSVDHTLGQMSGSTIFTKLDANSGFHQIKLAEDSQQLTTFITPFGRYCYCRMPFGINSGPEHFQRQIHQILEGVEGVTCLMDDIVVFAKTEEQHDVRLNRVLQKLSAAGVTLNKAKCQFKQCEIKFLGHVISNGKVKVDNDKRSAVLDAKPSEHH